MEPAYQADHRHDGVAAHLQHRFFDPGGVGNPRTLGQLQPSDRLLSGFFNATMLRTAGFNGFDPGQLNSGTLLGSDVLMFIGGGSAGTAGGIKVTTFVLLLS